MRTGGTYSSAASLSAAGRPDVAVGVGTACCVLRDTERRVGRCCGHAAGYYFPQQSVSIPANRRSQVKLRTKKNSQSGSKHSHLMPRAPISCVLAGNTHATPTETLLYRGAEGAVTLVKGIVTFATLVAVNMLAPL